jgi:hypothetical protein
LLFFNASDNTFVLILSSVRLQIDLAWSNFLREIILSPRSARRMPGANLLYCSSVTFKILRLRRLGCPVQLPMDHLQPLGRAALWQGWPVLLLGDAPLSGSILTGISPDK